MDTPGLQFVQVPERAVLLNPGDKEALLSLCTKDTGGPAWNSHWMCNMLLGNFCICNITLRNFCTTFSWNTEEERRSLWGKCFHVWASLSACKNVSSLYHRRAHRRISPLPWYCASLWRWQLFPRNLMVCFLDSNRWNWLTTSTDSGSASWVCPWMTGQQSSTATRDSMTG